jgi:putative DNA primase/helicase
MTETLPRTADAGATAACLVITTGAGKLRPQGRRVAVGATARDFATALASLPATTEGWWSPHVFASDYRKGEAWESSSAVAIDLDYHDAAGAHTSPPPETARALLALAKGKLLPGSLFHETPRGARLVFVLDEQLEDPDAFDAIAREAGRRTAAALGALGGRPGYEVDGKVLTDRARFLFSPRAIVGGTPRNAALEVLREEPFTVAELLPAGPAPVPAALPSRPAALRSPLAAERFEDAKRAYNEDHPGDWPKSGGTCPACGHHDCFGRLPSDPSRWSCFSTGHTAPGIEGSGCFHGDALDLDAHLAGLSPVELLRREGYLVQRNEPRRLATNGAAPAPDATPTPDAAALEPERPVLRVTGGDLSELATEAERALIGWGPPVYCRGDMLVRPVVEDVDATHGHKTRVARLRKVDAAWLRDALCRSAFFERFDKRSKAWRRIDPPVDVAETLLARDGEWSLPPIVGVITTPTLRADGTPLAAPGYDPATRLLLVAPPAMPPIPDAPSREEANRALFLLLELLAEFPFVDEASRSVALSMLLTPIARGAFAVAPAHAASASTPGTGKSYLADLSAAICMGQRCPAMAAGRDEAETEKRLVAALIAGQQLIALDNVNGELGGDTLCQLIERPVVEVRILGLSKVLRVESRATVILNGNNLALLGDMTRRVLLARLDAGVERPELRRFKRDPFAAVLADRGRYVAAALTILRAYIAAGRPDPAPPLASFKGWSDTVRSALMWLGCADPVDTMETARAEDPVLAQLRAVLSAWKDALGTGYQNAHTAAELLGLADESELRDGVPVYRRPALREALLSVGASNGRPNTKTFGKWLARNKGRIADGVRIARMADEHGHAARWWLDPVAVTAVQAISFSQTRESVRACG